MINYADRAALSSVFALLREQLHLSDASLGLVGAVFLWSYALFSPFAGYLADRYSRTMVIGWSLALWSLVTGLTGLANGFAALVLLRILLGLTESLFLPSAIALLADHHGVKTRGSAMALLSVGIALGGIIGGTSVGYLAEHYGWRSGFFILGLLGIGLAFLSSLFLTDGPTKPVAKADRLSFAVALRYLARVPTYYLLMGKTMLAGIGTWIFFSWMPLYFHDTFGLGLAAAAFAGTFTFSAAGMLGTAVGGWLSDRVASRDSRHRMLLLAVSYFASTPFLLTFLFHPSLTLVTAAIVAYSILRGLGAANENPCLCEVVPPQFRSTAVGIMNCMATAAGGGGVLVAGILKKDFGLAMVFGGVSVVIFLAGAAMLTGYYVFMRRDIGRAQVYATTAGA